MRIITRGFVNRLAAHLVAALALGSVAAITGCSDRNILEPENKTAEAPAGLVVSNAVKLAADPDDPDATLGVAQQTVAYVSAAPGTFSSGDSAFLRNATTGAATLWIPLTNGGFDPVGIKAKEGNTLSLTPFSRGISGSEIRVTVPVNRPPSIVRATPTNQLTHVGKYLHASVVFTEPVDASSLTDATVALFRNGAQAQVSISVSDDRLSAELVSAAPLEPATTYSLKIKGLRDLDGEMMVGENAESFTAEEIAQSTTVSTLAFVSARDGIPHIYLANSNGTEIRRLTDRTYPEYAPTWSPDGKMLAFNGFDSEVYVVNSDGTGLRKLEAHGLWPAWSPSSTQLVVSDLNGNGLKILNLDGSVERELSLDGINAALDTHITPRNPRWAPDGKRIAFTSFLFGLDMDRSFLIDTAGSTMSSVIFGQHTGWYECGPVWSPDAKQVALLTGLYGVAIVEVGRGSPRNIVTPPANSDCWDNDQAGGIRSSSGVDWSLDGRQIAVTLRDATGLSISVVDVATGAFRTVIRDAYDPAWSR